MKRRNPNPTPDLTNAAMTAPQRAVLTKVLARAAVKERCRTVFTTNLVMTWGVFPFLADEIRWFLLASNG